MNGLKTDYWNIFEPDWFQGADTLEKIVTFNKQLRQFKKVHERFVLHKKYPLTNDSSLWGSRWVLRVKLAVEILFTRILYDLAFNSIVAHFHIYEYIHICIFRKSSFIRNKLLTEESLREDSMEEENYIPEVGNQHLYYFHSLLSIIIIIL